MLDAILPAGAVLAEERGPAGEHAMHPAEAGAVARAVPSRRREFAATRACARTAPPVSYTHPRAPGTGRKLV